MLAADGVRHLSDAAHGGEQDAHADQVQHAPRPSHIINHPELAETFQAIASQGKEGFYTGRIAKCECARLVLLTAGGYVRYYSYDVPIRGSRPAPFTSCKAIG
jgi:gamma-glutamyltranspeptidase